MKLWMHPESRKYVVNKLAYAIRGNGNLDDLDSFVRSLIELVEVKDENEWGDDE